MRFLGAVTINIYILYGWLFWFVFRFRFFFFFASQKRDENGNDSQRTDGNKKWRGPFGRDRPLRDRPKHDAAGDIEFITRLL